MNQCCIKDCKKRTLARGMCAMHYRRFRKYGDPTQVKLRQLHGADLETRFLHYASKGEGCWEWSGSKDVNGYGRLNIDGKPELAHRLAWRLYRHPINSDQHVLHRCDNPQCVNPKHLFLGDQAANNADARKKGRFKPGISIGEEHGMAKLTETQVRKIRSSSKPPQQIADQLGISRRQVRDIQAKRAWRHLP